MLEKTQYYDEFLRYYEMASWQHKNCNLGMVDYKHIPYDDDLMKEVHLYDVVERKYAGFTQLLLDICSPPTTHPYAHKMPAWRTKICKSFADVRLHWDLPECLFIFFVHRLTGSGINYAMENSGYYNSVLLKFNKCETVGEMVAVIKEYQGPKYTSCGYQIAPFPKPMDGFTKGGDWFLCMVLPSLVLQFANYLESGKRFKSFRDLKNWLEKFNKDRGFRVFRFQYGAVLADIADFLAMYVDRDSHFFYGKNAEECLNYLAKKPSGQGRLEFLDQLMDEICIDTGMLPYNAEDVACDFIRWVENYVNTKSHYSHLDLDKVWSSHQIYDHPFGRQKAMLDLGLVETFNGMPHPSDGKIIEECFLTVDQYKEKVNELRKSS